MSTSLLPLCSDCKHFTGVEPGVGFVCRAFGDGIPVEILSSSVDHREPFKGDGGVRYERKPPLRAAGVVIEVEGSVLMLRRTMEGDHQGEWEFPGGMIEAGETAEEAARRECKEEVGSCPEGQFEEWTRQVRDGVDFTTFHVKVPEKFDPKLNSEHDAWDWVSTKQSLHSEEGQI